ncbi:MAG TPA: PhzF family phenazine biosynthesis isomerase [Puia sp.]|nr:PhzF family phenazine biosynthesis isomerase [Puia sp.]
MKIYQVDAFAGQLFHGNPAAVVPLDEWLPEGLMQQIAMENNLAETAFVVREGSDFRVRWFTPSTEVDLCGHATLAAAFVLYRYEGYAGDMIRFHSKSGLLTVSRRGEMLSLNFPVDQLTEVGLSPELTAGFEPKPAGAYRGRTDFMLVFESEKDIRELHVDIKRLAHIDARGIIVTAPGENADFVSRFFAPQSGIDEDPVTGSAHTTLTPYWAGRLGKTKLTAIQLSARGGWLECELIADRVLITGQAAAYMTGEIMPADAGIGPARRAELPGASTLSIAGLQQAVDLWIRTTGIRYFSELTNMAILTEEVGEVARLMSRIYGDQSFKDSDKDRDLSDELADVLWVLICIANQTGVDLTAAVNRNFKKKNDRDHARHRSNPKLS